MLNKRRIFLISTAISFPIIVTAINLNNANISLPERIKFLMGEMTMGVDRQQQALDELLQYGDRIEPFLYQYFDDDRLLASSDVSFLNSNPRAIEKYFHTSARTISEAMVRYTCWHTAACDPNFQLAQLPNVKQALRARRKR